MQNLFPSEINGVLLVDKPAHCTSHDVVQSIRKKTGIKSVGHSGTLDPLATGLLVVLIGQATKISNYLLNKDKTYEAGVRLGVQTDSWDTDGNIIAEHKVTSTAEEVKNTALALSGVLDLQVPPVSAVKVDGKKLYDYLRKDQEVKIVKRPMSFYDLEVLGFNDKSLTVRLSCQKGGYVRSWAYQLGENLNCGAIIESLRRTKSFPYNVNQAQTLEEIFENSERFWFESLSFIPLEKCLPEWTALTVSGRDEKLMSNGQIPSDLMKRLTASQKKVNHKEERKGIRIFGGEQRKVIALLELQPFTKPKVSCVFKT